MAHTTDVQASSREDMRQEETGTVDLDALSDSVAVDLLGLGDACAVSGSGLQLNPQGTGRLATRLHRGIAGAALLTDDFWNVRHM